jgi:hypothetical protein
METATEKFKRNELPGLIELRQNLSKYNIAPLDPVTHEHRIASVVPVYKKDDRDDRYLSRLIIVINFMQN